MEKKRIKIFDTTLRDGEQSPGCSMNLQEKLELAKQLEKLNVDVIEAGFAISSPGDFKAVREIAKMIKNASVASLARTIKKDIDAAYEAVKYAKYPRIHMFIATSDIHMKYKLKMEPEVVYQRAVEMVTYAKKLCADIEFTCEDATRTDKDFLCRVIEGVIEAGATVINIPDTVGYTVPKEYYELIKYVIKKVKGIDKVDISVHCHNDLGLAVANSLAAIEAGATQIECTLNGIGERAGNAALEEIVMTLDTRKDIYDYYTKIETRNIYPASQLVSKLTGVKAQPNKAIVGDNAFAHEAGIHQHGVLVNDKTYEIMRPESVGIARNKMILGKHSGRHAFVDYLSKLGYELSEQNLEDVFKQFKLLADKKKVVSDLDLVALVSQKQLEVPKTYELDTFIINSGNVISSMCSVKVRKDGQLIEGVSVGDGPIDALFNAVESIVGYKIRLKDYGLNSVTDGKDAQGEAYVKIEYKDVVYHGRGLSVDIIQASVLAYIDAVNQVIHYGL